MKAFFTGVGIGVGLGVLFAPDSGEATRSKLRERFSELVDDFGRQVDKAKDVVEQTMTAYPKGSSGESEHTNTDFPPKKDQAREVRASSSDPINTISREELMNVNGIGPVLADKIISSRPYSSRRELVDRGILAQSTFEELEGELSRHERRSA